MPTQYVTSEGLSLAYQVRGNGPALLHLPGAISHLAMEDAHPGFARYSERLGRFCRLIRFDKRGTGLSDRSLRPTTIEQQLVDVEAVRQATGADQAAIVGHSHGASLAALYAATYPEHVTHLILVNGVCCNAADPFAPLSDENQLMDWDRTLEVMATDFPRWSRAFARLAFPNARGGALDSIIEYVQATASPGAFQSIWRGMQSMDLRPSLRRITAPTLVMYSRGDRLVPPSHSRYFAEHIADARIIELATNTHLLMADEKPAAQCVVAIEEFLLGSASHSAERVVVSVLFTDIVDSTGQQQARGDQAWSGVRKAFETESTRQVAQYGGRVVQFLGDGIMAAFPAPGDALRAAQALVADAEAQGFQIRAGMSTGEAYDVDGELHGTCVTIAARVSAHAGPSELLTTEVVQGLVEGSGFRFEPIGAVDLKGLGPRRLVRLS